MAEKLAINREIQLSYIAARDGDLQLLVRELESPEGEMTSEELELATARLEKVVKQYGLSIEEMNHVYEIIRDQPKDDAK